MKYTDTLKSLEEEYEEYNRNLELFGEPYYTFRKNKMNEISSKIKEIRRQMKMSNIYTDCNSIEVPESAAIGIRQKLINSFINNHEVMEKEENDEYLIYIGLLTVEIEK